MFLQTRCTFSVGTALISLLCTLSLIKLLIVANIKLTSNLKLTFKACSSRVGKCSFILMLEKLILFHLNSQITDSTDVKLDRSVIDKKYPFKDQFYFENWTGAFTLSLLLELF